MPPQPIPPPYPAAPPASDDPSEALSRCLLTQFKFCAAGVGLGGYYGAKAKAGVAPMIAAGVAGSLADLLYGWTAACEEEVRRYREQPPN